jgi:hypothetical protein
LQEKYPNISTYAYVANNTVNLIDPTGMDYDWVQDKDKRIKWDKNATKDTPGYLGKTVYATDSEGNFKYGDQYGNWHESASLGEVSVTGFQTSGKGPVSSGIRNAARGYDPKWIAGFHQFVDAGLTAIDITLFATTLASYTESMHMYNGLRARAALNAGNAAKTNTTVLEGTVKSNYGRFVSKMPANAKSSATFKQLKGGNYLFEATSPGKVPGSRALYQKWVNPQGKTFKMIKTTFGPDGSIIHVKTKF